MNGVLAATPAQTWSKIPNDGLPNYLPSGRRPLYKQTDNELIFKKNHFQIIINSCNEQVEKEEDIDPDGLDSFEDMKFIQNYCINNEAGDLCPYVCTNIFKNLLISENNIFKKIKRCDFQDRPNGNISFLMIKFLSDTKIKTINVVPNA